MQTPHFKFLESLVREVPLPPSAGSEVHWRTDLADQPSFSGFYPSGSRFCFICLLFCFHCILPNVWNCAVICISVVIML